MNFFIKYTAKFCCLLFVPFVFAQKSSRLYDEQIKNINTIRFNKHLHSNKDSAFFYVKKLKEIKSPCEYTTGLFMEAKLNYFKRNCVESKRNAIVALRELERRKPKIKDYCYGHNKISALRWLSESEKCLGNYEKALNYLIEALELSNHEENIYDTYRIGIATDIGRLKTSLGLLEEGNLDLKKGIEDLAKKKQFIKDFEFKYGSTLNNIGQNYLLQYAQHENISLLDSAKLYFVKANSILVEKNGGLNQFDEGLYYLRIAKLFYLKKEYNISINHLRLSEKYNLNSNPSYYHKLNILYALNYFNMEEIDSAIFFIQKNLDRKTGQLISNNHKLLSYNILSDIYNKKGDSKRELYYLRQIRKIEKSENIQKASAWGSLYSHRKKNISKSDFLNFTLIDGVIVLLISAIIFAGIALFYSNKKNKPDEIKKFNKRNISKEYIYKIKLMLQKAENKEYHIRPAFSLVFLAKKLETNTSYLSEYFKKIKQQSFRDYVNEYRLNYLLKNYRLKFKNYTLKTIAKELGYKDSKQFSKYFRHKMKRSFSQYVREINENL